jgi:hypothetical protein
MCELWEASLWQRIRGLELVKKHFWVGCSGFLNCLTILARANQLVEIQQAVNQRGIWSNERRTERLYWQVLAFLSASSEQVQEKMAAITQE